MLRNPTAAVALALSAFALVAAGPAFASDPASPADAFALGRSELPLAPDAPPFAVLPLPMPWDLPDTSATPAPESVLVGGSGCTFTPTPSSCASERWRFIATLPIWIPTVSGTFASGGVSASADRDPPDLGGIFEELLPDVATSLEFAFMGRFTAYRGPWSITTDGLYASIGETIDWKLRDADTTGSLDAGIARIYGAWQTTKRLGCGPCAPVLRYGPLVGARAYWVSLQVDRANAEEIDADANWIDPILGLKADLTFHNGASIDVVADFGGALDWSHYSWSISAELTWPLGRGGHWFILGGWTILNVDHDIPLGSNDLEVHLHLSGPHLGITYRF